MWARTGRVSSRECVQGKQRAWSLCCWPASFLNGELPCPIKDGQPWVKMAESGMVLCFSVLDGNSCCKEKRAGVREDAVSLVPARCGSRVCFDQRPLLAFWMRAAWDARHEAPSPGGKRAWCAQLCAQQRRGKMIPPSWMICPWRTPTSYVTWDKPPDLSGPVSELCGENLTCKTRMCCGLL